jgi:hypothetical protein
MTNPIELLGGALEESFGLISSENLRIPAANGNISGGLGAPHIDPTSFATI